MGIEACRQLQRDPEKDSLLITSRNPAVPPLFDQHVAAEEEDDDKYTKRRRNSRPALTSTIDCLPALILVVLVFILYVGSRDSTRSSAFPWPSPCSLPEPPFIKEGIEQCKIVQRQAGGKEWDKERKENDR